MLDELPSFPARLYATRCLANSQQEERHAENDGLPLEGRDWRWRVRQYRYHEDRIASDRGYAGSYAMDALAMALHCVHATESLEAAMRKAASLCGDADTVAAVTGQLAGAVYGVSAIPASWREAIGRWEQPAGAIQCRAWLLCETSAPTVAAVRAHERRDDESWPAYEQRLADAARSKLMQEAEQDEAAAAAQMPLECPCGRRFANATVQGLHKRKCDVFLGGPTAAATDPLVELS